jgi:hypothetical protein
MSLRPTSTRVSDKKKFPFLEVPILTSSLLGFDRNAKWSLTTFPELQQLDLSCNDRMVKTFEGCLVSIRLLMFHVFFLDFVKPRGLSLPRIKVRPRFFPFMEILGY